MQHSVMYPRSESPPPYLCSYDLQIDERSPQGLSGAEGRRPERARGLKWSGKRALVLQGCSSLGGVCAGLAEYFRKSSDEEREHAEKLMVQQVRILGLIRVDNRD